MTDFSAPTPVSDADMAFPARALDIMPKMEDIPEDFRKRLTPWNEMINCWFSTGFDSRFSFQPEEGLSGLEIYRHLHVIMGSYAPKHEHKMAAAAYLASLWMESILWGPPDSEWEDLRTIGPATIEEWQEHFDSEGERHIIGEELDDAADH